VCVLKTLVSQPLRVDIVDPLLAVYTYASIQVYTLEYGIENIKGIRIRKEGKKERRPINHHGLL
jgi:hypothetical protein